MRRLRGLYVEDDELTFKLTQRVFKTSGTMLQMAAGRTSYLDLIKRPALDFVILDGEIPGWPLADYAKDVAETTTLPLFIYSASPAKNLGPLIALEPKAVLRKTAGPQVLSDAVHSYFYALEQFMFLQNLPKSSLLS